MICCYGRAVSCRLCTCVIMSFGCCVCIFRTCVVRTVSYVCDLLTGFMYSAVCFYFCDFISFLSICLFRFFSAISPVFPLLSPRSSVSSRAVLYPVVPLLFSVAFLPLCTSIPTFCIDFSHIIYILYAHFCFTFYADLLYYLSLSSHIYLYRVVSLLCTYLFICVSLILYLSCIKCVFYFFSVLYCYEL